MTTTTATLTVSQIEALRTEAGAAGDSEQVVLCDLALAGNETARAKCAKAIASAEAMDETRGSL